MSLAGVALARHGETPYNAEGRFQGHLPVGLTDRGLQQAHELARLAAQREWAALWCSPLERARRTAAIVSAAIGLEPREDARFAETHTGDWTGRAFAEVQAEDPDGFAAFERTDLGWGFPGGESFREQSDRIWAGLQEVAGGPLPALVVCHRGVIRLALTRATGADTVGRDQIPNAALFDLP
ncbi:histidine phosphatase family protein [Conexibacter sp. SYSU D00693]|uniref:histidine phosphatase family protein n=1 Tax=Conexibacter sp. SYSU D00693 TaxID=2812560 RepID=UPI00196B2F23|nr:histidine phosphatase family protein [Conexibacter sp. SYSU D00693]